MAAENCSFQIIKKKIQDEKENEQFVSFDYIIGLDNDNIKTTLKVKKLSTNDVKEILCFIKEINDLIDELKIGEGPLRFRLIKRLLSGNIKQHWHNKKDEYKDDDQVLFAAVKKTFYDRKWRMKFLLERKNG